ncbi:hypothetical protein FRAHR75_370049 [Frankia sp. Hr75.2]|nr:hypothetical protein FRAHR75_370049 [Frankia sp. Hr75.2]
MSSVAVGGWIWTMARAKSAVFGSRKRDPAIRMLSPSPRSQTTAASPIRGTTRDAIMSMIRCGSSELLRTRLASARNDSCSSVASSVTCARRRRRILDSSRTMARPTVAVVAAQPAERDSVSITGPRLSHPDVAGPDAARPDASTGSAAAPRGRLATGTHLPPGSTP